MISEQFRSGGSSYGMASRGSSPRRRGPIAIAMLAILTSVVVSGGFCPPRCRCDDETLKASCAYADFEFVPIQLNPEIRHLDLSNNRVANLHLTFGFYGNLESLDLSSNLIRTLGTDNFSLQTRLLNLNVSYNSIRTIAKNALNGLKSLRELNLADNNITEMDEQAFKYTSELEVLDLSGNSITSLPKDLMKNLHKIRTLVLKRNSLLEVPADNLALAPSLENVDLSENLIQELTRDSLPSLPSLVSLNLADNVIRSIADDVFDRLPGLLRLDLSGNNLTSVPTAALARLNVLSSLILNRNPLGTLHPVAFRNLFELRSLELDDCTLENIHARAFADNVNLERISMDGNRELKELPGRVLYSARYLKSVSLRHCSLATLQPTQFPVDDLALLRVGGNPLVCNCSVHWLWNVIRAEEQRNETRLELDTNDIVCTDEESAGKPLIALPEGSLRCRLSLLYLSLSATGCLAATASILALIAHLTRAKRKKRLAYAAPNRPEFLVYVGRSNEDIAKNAESCNRRLLARHEDTSYDTPRAKTVVRVPRSQDRNIYETPRYARPERRLEVIEPPTTIPGVHGRQQQQQPLPLPHQQQQQQQQQQPPLDEGVYAVADVTGLREEPPEMLSLYRMQNTRMNVQRADYGYDYDYDYDYEPPLPDKPHVVFV
ncbi:hypothetical protein M0804_000311 [Polistes exclamans]|nr:hypothetical protein M0804_000311 [Polistes exclamans]